jgi:3-oxoacyl-[acyl-carrier-protein] synthase III
MTSSTSCPAQRSRSRVIDAPGSGGRTPRACITAIEYYLPEGVLTNEDLSRDFPQWSAEKILQKTGITRRHVANPSETAVDLAVKAGERLFSRSGVTPDQVDFIVLCTQTPDFYLPTSACLVQDRLGITRRAGSLDINQGCAGFIYGLAVAKGLVETGSAGRVLLLTADTYSRLVRKEDWNVRSLFSDGAAATLISAVPADPGEKLSIGPFCFGTDGSGAEGLIVRTGGFRNPVSAGSEPPHVEMNGPAIFAFGLERVPQAVGTLLEKEGMPITAVDLLVFHQASTVMLESLRKCLRIPAERFFVNISEHGNTISSTIPIALRDAHAQGRLRPSDTVLLSGYGVGLSWGATLVRPALLRPADR